MALKDLGVLVLVVFVSISTYVGLEKLFGHWVPSDKTDPIVFVTGGEKPAGIIELKPNGVLSISVTGVYEELQKQSKVKKDEKKK